MASANARRKLIRQGQVAKDGAIQTLDKQAKFPRFRLSTNRQVSAQCYVTC
jgi:hypothetical protein